MKKMTLAAFAALLLAFSCSEALIGIDSTAEIAASSRAISDEITVLSVWDREKFHYGIPARHRTVTVKVKDLGENKVFFIHGELADGTWDDLNSGYNGPFSYVGEAEPGYQIYKINASWTSYYGATAWDDEFVVRYEVDGQTYWANNGGQNYAAEAHSGTRLYGSDVMLYSKSFSEWSNSFYGNIDLQNLAYHKEVKIVYTTDGWNTVNEGFATFQNYIPVSYASPIPSPNTYGVERWTFDIPVPEGVGREDIEFAIAYTPQGMATRWDNNYGKNYSF
jgi:hypothetical protein